jgi:hypothetical protein
VLQQVPGVGTLTSPTFVLTLEETPIASSREPRGGGIPLGLVPAQEHSGDRDPKRGSPKKATRCSGGFW